MKTKFKNFCRCLKIVSVHLPSHAEDAFLYFLYLDKATQQPALPVRQRSEICTLTAHMVLSL